MYSMYADDRHVNGCSETWRQLRAAVVSRAECGRRGGAGVDVSRKQQVGGGLTRRSVVSVTDRQTAAQ